MNEGKPRKTLNTRKKDMETRIKRGNVAYTFLCGVFVN